MTDDIKVIFVVPKGCRSENECSEEMKLAFIVSFTFNLFPNVKLVIVIMAQFKYLQPNDKICFKSRQIKFINLSKILNYIFVFQACEQHSSGGLKAQWVQETQYNQFEGLSKRDVFVLSEFDGELYERLRLTKCL